MSIASLSFYGLDAATWVAIAATVAVILVAIMYWRTRASMGVRLACAALKIVGLLALAACLLEPVWSRSRAKPGANYFAVLADNSQGLQVRDGGEPRAAQLNKLLAAQGWAATLGETYTVRNYSFDTRLHTLENFAALDHNGPASRLGGSLRTLGDRYRGQPLAGVLLFTDGNATDISGSFDTAGLPPIYPVVLGTDDLPRDVALQRVSLSQSAFEDAPVTLQAEVAATGCRGEDIILQVLDGAGAKIEELKQKADNDDKVLSFRLTLRPPSRGISFYTVRAALRFEAATAGANQPASTEATLANNSRTVAVNRGRGQHRILYVSGRPNWEFKFLNRALAGEEELQLVGLIRIARREPKFEFMGRRGESGNPLFRGFDRQDEEAERYDQPVLVRLNTRDELELKGGFPKTAEDLYGYDAIIVDDLEADFFTRDQMSLLQKFVSERGGGVLMLGGAETFHEGKFARTPIGDMLPVYLDRPPAESLAGGAKLALTREGWLQPWLRVRDNESDERARLSVMPAFEVLNAARDVKPGASVLATVEANGATRPALVAQRFGQGRTAALLVGDLWLWGLRDETMHRDMDKHWRQLMRWLVTDVPAPVELHATPSTEHDGITLQVTARNKRFEPLDNANVSIQVTASSSPGNSTNTIRLAAQPGNAPGVYTATFIPRQPGGFRAEAVVIADEGTEIGRAEAGWTSDPAAEEFRSLKPNRALLEQIARSTGGEVVPARDLEKFARSLPNRKAPVTETVSSPLWHTPAMFAFALVCFVGEWGVRRWKGLP